MEKMPSGIVADVEGGGFEDLAPRGAGEVGQVVRGVRVAPQELGHDHGGGAVPHLASGDLAVFDVDDGALGVLGCEVVDDHLTAGAELCRQGGGDLLEHPGAVLVQRRHPLPRAGGPL